MRGHEWMRPMRTFREKAEKPSVCLPALARASGTQARGGQSETPVNLYWRLMPMRPAQEAIGEGGEEMSQPHACRRVPIYIYIYIYIR